MIRLVHISKSDEVMADKDCFAWFDTVSDEFVDFCRESVWTTWDEFRSDAMEEGHDDYTLKRFWNLYDGADK